MSTTTQLLGSPLRNYVVALVSRSQLSGSKDLHEPETYPHEMLVDIINWVARNKREKSSGKYTKVELEQFFVAEVDVRESFSALPVFKLTYIQINSRLHRTRTPSPTEVIDLETPPQTPVKSFEPVTPAQIATE
jgi:hypothetical protein